jgi:CheY-like chemotaxis protein
MDAIGKLTGGIAHDFNNLLAAVIGGLSILEKRAALGEEDSRILGMTRRAAEQGSELVRRLLAFARRQTLEPKRIRISALQETVSDLLTHTLGGLVDLKWKVGKDVVDPFADRAQLELALVNLIINARDAMPDGGTVMVSVENRHSKPGEIQGLAGGDYVRLAVSDRGTGIAPEHIEKVLEPFFTTKDVGKGSGLGLPMVYGFAKQSNGAFRLESQVGRGTTAELWLPQASEQLPEKEQKPDEEIPEAAGTRPLKILLVDDHPEVRTTTAALLQELGHTVVEASNGGEALTALNDGARECDLVISDYAMPHLSGTEFVRRARRICPEMPALIITGYAESDAVRDRPEDVDILLKPFTPRALKSAIARICGSGQPGVS